ncbi:hypothetical protein SGPA1_11511 [Streptomyces misionensis JCM 4497]
MPPLGASGHPRCEVAHRPVSRARSPDAPRHPALRSRREHRRRGLGRGRHPLRLHRRRPARDADAPGRRGPARAVRHRGGRARPLAADHRPALGAARGGGVRLAGAAARPRTGIPRRGAGRRRGGRLVPAVRGALRGRLGPVPGRPARAGGARGHASARGAVQLQHPRAGAQAARPRSAGPLRGRAVRRRAGRLQAEPRRLPCRLRGAGPAPAPGGVRRRSPGDRRAGCRRGRPGVRVDRPGSGSRAGRRSAGRAPDHQPRRTPRAAALGYSFWSPVHLRVMFFLRRGERAERPEPRGAS